MLDRSICLPILMIIPLLVLSMAAASLTKTATMDDHCNRQMSQLHVSSYNSANFL